MPRLLCCLMAAALVAVFLWSAFVADFGGVGPAPAHAQTICLTVEETERYVVETYPGSQVFVHFQGKEAQEFMGFFNSLAPGALRTGPATDYAGDEIIGFYHPDEPVLLLIVFVDGCRTGRILMSPMQFRQQYPDLELPSGGPA